MWIHLQLAKDNMVNSGRIQQSTHIIQDAKDSFYKEVSWTRSGGFYPKGFT